MKKYLPILFWWFFVANVTANGVEFPVVIGPFATEDACDLRLFELAVSIPPPTDPRIKHPVKRALFNFSLPCWSDDVIN